MIAVFMAPFYILINIYIIRWMLKWMGACHYLFQGTGFRVLFIGFYIFLSTSLLTGFFVQDPPWLHRLFKNVGNYFLGTFAYILLTILLVDLGRLFFKYVVKAPWVSNPKTFLITGALSGILIISISVYGIFHARNVHLTHYSVSVEKSVPHMEELRIALVADTHFGYSIGTAHAEKMVKLINDSDVDIVCIAGDIFDNEFDAVKEPKRLQEILKGIKSTYGVYACWGNHDLNEPILAGFTFDKPDDPNDYQDARMEAFLREADIHLLNDQAELIDGKFYVIGRRDASRYKKVEGSRKTPEELTAPLDKEKPILLLDHQPKELKEAALAGVDLDLCGHTHDGQMFPGNILTSLMWENSCGYLKKDSMHNIVTSGLGVWGPNMRVGTKSEICIIDVKLKPA